METQEAVIKLLADVLRGEPPEEAPEIVELEMRQTGLRRAIWAAYDDIQRERVIRAALRKAKEARDER